MSGSSGAPYWLAYAGSWRQDDDRVDGQPNDYRERMAMFGIHAPSATQGTPEPVSKVVAAENQNDETADVKDQGNKKVEQEADKKEENKDDGNVEIKGNKGEENNGDGIVDVKGKGEEKEDK